MTTIEKTARDLKEMFNQPDYTELINRITALEKKVENLENEVAGYRAREWQKIYDGMGVM